MMLRFNGLVDVQSSTTLRRESLVSVHEGYSDDEDVYDNSRVESKPSGEKDDGKQSPSTGPNENTPPLREVIDRLKNLGLENLGLQMLTSSTSHILPGARDFIMNNPVFLNINNVRDETTAMRLIAENKLTGAEMDSFARDPPPRCYPGTRHSLRTSVITWLMDDNRQSSLFWLHGPAGVGKSTVAQTIAEYCANKPRDEAWWLGAALFLSRPNRRNDPTRIIPSLAYQLAVRFPVYKRIIASLLAGEPSIFEKNLHIQFTKMIIEPLSQLHSELDTSHPILILLDGLDECHGDKAQQTLIELIGSFSAIGHSLCLPFVWIIVSRPEWQIVSAFAKIERLGRLWKEELTIHTFEAQADVANFLRAGFHRISDRFGDTFSPGRVWPTAEQLMVVRSAASGLFVFASTILDFVGDEEVGNPILQLDLCLRFLRGTLLSPTGSPLTPLDSLYTGILRTIHQNALPITLQILSALRFSKGIFSAQTLANFLFLDQSTFYASLRKLHSVLIIPSSLEAGRVALQVRHASFEGFLDSILGSGGLGAGEHEMDAHISRACIRWIGLRGEMIRNKRIVGVRTEFLSANVPWYHPRSFHNIIALTGKHIWSLLSKRAINGDITQLYQDLNQFDFASYDRVYSPYEPIHTFNGNATHVASLVCKLRTWEEQSHQSDEGRIIRLKPEYLSDQNLFQHYAFILTRHGIMGADFSRLEAAPHQWSFLGLSDTRVSAPLRVREVRRALLDPLAMCFLLGHETKTCLVIAYRPNITVKQFLSNAFQQIRSMYSANMPPTWPLPHHIDLIASKSIIPQSSISAQHELRLTSSVIYSITAFVADPQHADPMGRLNWIVNLLSSPLRYTRIEILDLIRKKVLSDIPDHIRPIVNKILLLLMRNLTRDYYDWSAAPILADHLARRVIVVDREEDVERALRIVNLLISNRPLLFPLGSVLDFGFSDVPAYVVPSDIHYPWCYVATLDRAGND